MTPETTRGHKIYDLDGGVWNVPDLWLLLERIVPEHGVMKGFEVKQDFPRIGRRTMLLNARKVFYEESGHTIILLAFEEATGRRRSQAAYASGRICGIIRASPMEA